MIPTEQQESSKAPTASASAVADTNTKFAANGFFLHHFIAVDLEKKQCFKIHMAPMLHFNFEILGRTKF